MSLRPTIHAGSIAMTSFSPLRMFACTVPVILGRAGVDPPRSSGRSRELADSPAAAGS